jgi:hypothetical protein
VPDVTRRQWLVSLVICAVSSVAWLGYESLQHRLFVANRSGQGIKFLEIIVAKTTIRFENVDAGTTVRSRFPVASDDHFVVLGLLEDGTPIHAALGYVTNGVIGYRANFTVLAGGVVTLDLESLQ